VIEMKDLKQSTPNEARSAGLLAKSGIFSQLKAACLTLVNGDPELIRSMMISVGVDEANDVMDDAIRHYAAEHCVVADVERPAGSLVIRLRRKPDGSVE
jgi:hypothetical protein